MVWEMIKVQIGYFRKQCCGEKAKWIICINVLFRRGHEGFHTWTILYRFKLEEHSEIELSTEEISEQFNKMSSRKSQGPGSIKLSILKKLKYETAKLLIFEITLESREIESCKCDAIKKKFKEQNRKTTDQ